MNVGPQKKSFYLWDVYKTCKDNMVALSVLDESGEMSVLQVKDFRFYFYFMLVKEQSGIESFLTKREYEKIMPDLLEQNGYVNGKSSTLESFISKWESVEGYDMNPEDYQDEKTTFIKLYVTDHNSMYGLKNSLEKAMKMWRIQEHTNIKYKFQFYESTITHENRVLGDSKIQVGSWIEIFNYKKIKFGLLKLSKNKDEYDVSCNNITTHSTYNKTNKGPPPITILSMDAEMYTPYERFPIARFTKIETEKLKMDYEEVKDQPTDPVSCVCFCVRKLYTDEQEESEQVYVYTWKEGTVMQEKYQKVSKIKLKKIIYKKFDNELDMLRGFSKAVHDISPHVVTGWNNHAFDFKYFLDRLVVYDQKLAAYVKEIFSKKVSEPKTYNEINSEYFVDFMNFSDDNYQLTDYAKELANDVFNEINNNWDFFVSVRQSPEDMEKKIEKKVTYQMNKKTILGWMNRIIYGPLIKEFFKLMYVELTQDIKEEIKKQLYVRLRNLIVNYFVDMCFDVTYQCGLGFEFFRNFNVLSVDKIFTDYTCHQPAFNDYFKEYYNQKGFTRDEWKKRTYHYRYPSNKLLEWNNIPFRLFVDGMIIWIKDGKPGKGCGLNAVAELVLGDSKVNIDYKVMNRYWESNEKIKIGQKLRYCFKDAQIPIDIIVTKKFLDNMIQVSRISNITLRQYMGGQTKRVFHALIEKDDDTRDNLFVRDKERVYHYDDPDDILYNSKKKKEKFTGAKVFPPVPGFYEDPIDILDFQSLYPNIIIDNNICYTTLITEKKALKLGLDLKKDCNKVLIDAKNAKLGQPFKRDSRFRQIYFVKDHIRKGLLPQRCAKFLAARRAMKAIMTSCIIRLSTIKNVITLLKNNKHKDLTIVSKLEKELKIGKHFDVVKKEVEASFKKLHSIINDKEEKNTLKKLIDELQSLWKKIDKIRGIYDAIQQGLKVICNSFYGFTGYDKSPVARLELSVSVTTIGVMSITFLRDIAENADYQITEYKDYIKPENIKMSYNILNRPFLNDFDSYQEYYYDKLDCGKIDLDNPQTGFSSKYGDTDSIMVQMVKKSVFNGYKHMIPVTMYIMHMLSETMEAMFNDRTHMIPEYEAMLIRSFIESKKIYSFWVMEAVKLKKLRFDETDDDCVMRVKCSVESKGTVIKRGDSLPFTSRIMKNMMRLLLKGTLDPDAKPMMLLYEFDKVKHMIVDYLYSELFDRLLRNTVDFSDFVMKKKYKKDVDDYSTMKKVNGIQVPKTKEEILNGIQPHVAVVEKHKREDPNYIVPTFGTFVEIVYFEPKNTMLGIKASNSNDHAYKSMLKTKPNKMVMDPSYFLKDQSKEINLVYYINNKMINPILKYLQYVYTTQGDLDIIRQKFDKVGWYEKKKSGSIIGEIQQLIFGKLIELITTKYNNKLEKKRWGNSLKRKHDKTEKIDTSMDIVMMKKNYEKYIKKCNKCIKDNDSPISGESECTNTPCKTYKDKRYIKKFLSW